MDYFSFDATAGASQSSTRPKLNGNEIYEVLFDGCEVKDIQGVKDATKIYKTLVLRFSNSDGIFEHTVFEPDSDRGDFKRTESEYTNKNGNIEKIPQPSVVESMMLLFKHAIDSINPTVAKKIDTGEMSLKAKNWDELRKMVAAILNAALGAPVKIKLLKNNKNEAVFPGYFASINRDGKAYIRNNFIGSKIAFTAYEMTRIKNELTAKPTSMKQNLGPSEDLPGSNLDLSFDVLNL